VPVAIAINTWPSAASVFAEGLAMPLGKMTVVMNVKSNEALVHDINGRIQFGVNVVEAETNHHGIAKPKASPEQGPTKINREPSSFIKPDN
jgi:hypothetical protein